MVTLEIKEAGCTVWQGSKGHAFALRIGRSKRHDLAKFVCRNSRKRPIKVDIIRMESRRPDGMCGIVKDGVQKIGFLYKRFFVLMDFADVTDHVRSVINNISLFWTGNNLQLLF